MAKDVVMYSTNTCAYCHATRQYFEKKDIDFTEINLDEQPDKRQELIDLSGQMAVPVILITKDDGTKDVTVGYNVPKLASALGV